MKLHLPLFLRAAALACVAASPCNATAAEGGGTMHLYILTGQSNSLGSVKGSPATPEQLAQYASTGQLWNGNMTYLDNSGTVDSEAGTLFEEQPTWVTVAPQLPTYNENLCMGPEYGFSHMMLRKGWVDTASGDGMGVIKASLDGGGNGCWVKGSPTYDSLLASVKNAIDAMRASGTYTKISLEGLMYLQGESNSPSEAAMAKERYTQFLSDLKADLAAAGYDSPLLGGSVLGQSVLGEPATWNGTDKTNTVEQLKGLADESNTIGWVRTRDLTKITSGDAFGVHYDGKSQITIGARYAYAMALQQGKEVGAVRNDATGVSLNDGGAWWNGTAPTANDVVVWDVSSANVADTLSGDLAVQGIVVEDPFRSRISISAAGGTTPTLSLGGGGIELQKAGLDIGVNLTTTAEQTWQVAGGQSLTIGSSDQAVALGGGHTVSLNRTEGSEGRARVELYAAAGSVNRTWQVGNGVDFFLSSTGNLGIANLTLGADTAATFNGNTTITGAVGNSGLLTVNNTLTLTGNSSFTKNLGLVAGSGNIVANSGNGDRIYNLSGDLSGWTGGFQQSAGSGSMTLNIANTSVLNADITNQATTNAQCVLNLSLRSAMTVNGALSYTAAGPLNVTLSGNTTFNNTAKVNVLTAANKNITLGTNGEGDTATHGALTVYGTASMANLTLGTRTAATFNGNTTITGSVSNSGLLTVNNTLTLTGNSSFTKNLGRVAGSGNIVANSGNADRIYNLSGDLSGWTGGFQQSANSGSMTLNIANTSVLNADITNQATHNAQCVLNLSLRSAMTVNGALSYTAAGPLNVTLSGNTTFNNTAKVNVLTAANKNITLGTNGEGDTATHGALTVYGTASMANLTLGTRTAATFNGNTTITGSVSNSGLLTVNNTLTLTAGYGITKNLGLVAGSGNIVANSGNGDRIYNLSGDLSGWTGGFQQSAGSGSMTLNIANTSVLNADITNQATTNAQCVLNLSLRSAMTVNGALSYADDGPLNVTLSGDTTFNNTAKVNVLTAANKNITLGTNGEGDTATHGALTVNGTASMANLTLGTGTAATFNGNTTITGSVSNSGLLTVNNTLTLAAGSSATIKEGGALKLSGEGSLGAGTVTLEQAATGLKIGDFATLAAKGGTGNGTISGHTKVSAKGIEGTIAQLANLADISIEALSTQEVTTQDTAFIRYARLENVSMLFELQAGMTLSHVTFDSHSSACLAVGDGARSGAVTASDTTIELTAAEFASPALLAVAAADDPSGLTSTTVINTSRFNALTFTDTLTLNDAGGYIAGLFGANPGVEEVVVNFDGADLTGVTGITYTGTALPAGIQANIAQNAVVFSAEENVPEPTTTTLSLLALAAIAARRRRKDS